MDDKFSRTELLFGKSSMDKLKSSRVAVFGIGGVGSYVVEALARTGIGALDLIDDDKVSASNINRQIIATEDTIDRYKTEVAKERVLQINSNINVTTHNTFFLPETANEFDFSKYDYIVDAIDTITAKLELAVLAKAAGVPIISSMGTGNKLDPTAFEVTDIFKTSVCPLAKVMRHELKKRGIDNLKVVYSKEIPITPSRNNTEDISSHKKRQTPGSVAFVPSVAGLIIAGEVIKDIVNL